MLNANSTETFNSLKIIKVNDQSKCTLSNKKFEFNPKIHPTLPKLNGLDRIMLTSHHRLK